MLQPWSVRRRAVEAPPESRAYGPAATPRAAPSLPRLPTVRETVAVLVAVALVSLALPVWTTAQSGYQTLRALTKPWPPRTDRELGKALNGQLNGALLAAAQAIPRNATFSVRVGFDPPVDSAVVDGITGLFRYWLLPRTYTDVSHSADWIITFHHPTDTLGVNVAKVVPLGPYTNAVEVAR